MFILLCEYVVVSEHDEMNWNIVSKVLKMYFEVQILVIWNNHEYGVLMNGRVKFVENQGRNSIDQILYSLLPITWKHEK